MEGSLPYNANTAWGPQPMNKSKIIFLTSILLLTSCLKQSESINSFAEPKTIAELQQEALISTANFAGKSDFSSGTNALLEVGREPGVFYLKVKYNIRNIDVFEIVDMPNVFEQIGHTFLLRLAKLILSIKGSQNFNINAFDLTIPNLNLDKSVVKSIKVKRVFLQYNKEVDEASDFAANFNFLNSLELSRVLNINQIGKVDSLLLSYRKIHNNCMSKCLQFEIINENILDLLEPNSSIRLQPTLNISSFPYVTDMKLYGVIELQIGLKLPF